VSLIAAYSGMRLEEIAQLAVGDIRDQRLNGAHAQPLRNVQRDHATALVGRLLAHQIRS
jgi:hypothetical protein